MRRFLGFCFALLFVPLLGAAPGVLGAPRVIVYPFTPTGSTIDREASSRIATLIATQMAHGSDLTVLPPRPGTERKDYLDVARAERADYYVSGFISPLGTGVAIIEQLVSTETGVVVYSNTAQVATYAEITNEGDTLRTALLRHSARNLGAFAAPPPAQTTPTPVPKNQGNDANVSGGLGGLFKKKRNTAPTPTPTAKPAGREIANVAPPVPAPTVAPTLRPQMPEPTAPPTASPATPQAVALATATPRPAPTASPRPPEAGPASAQAPAIGVLTLAGGADAERKSTSRSALVAQFEHAGLHVVSIPGTAASSNLCAEFSVPRVLGGNLEIRTETTLGQQTSTATLLLVGYDCNGKVVYRKTFDRDAGGSESISTAVERVVDAAGGAYLHPSKKS